MAGEAVGHAVQVVAGKRLRQKFPDLRLNVLRPELQRLSEIANDSGQLYQKAAEAYVMATKQDKLALALITCGLKASP